MKEQFFKELASNLEGKNKLLSGLNKSCDIVSRTMGYRGKNNLYETTDGIPFITSDGWDSLSLLHWQDPIEQIALQNAKQACEKTYENAGDSTTLTCVLLQGFFQYSLKELEKGVSDIVIKDNIEKSVKKIVDFLESNATTVDEKLMYDVALTSAHGEHEIADIVREAFVKAGEYGTVSHNRSFTDKTFISFIDGNPIESGYTHEGYINVQETQSVVFHNPLVVVSETHFQTINELVPFLQIAFPENQPGEFIAPRPIVFIGTMEDNISAALLTNVRQHGLPIAVVRPPYLGAKGRENLADLALIFGCDIVEGVSKADYNGKEIQYLGTCEKIEIGLKDSVVTIRKDADKKKIQGRIDELTEQVKYQKNDGEKNYLKDRIAKISGGISTVMVGGVTLAETEERIARVDDAVKAVKSSKEEGVIAGGGVMLYNASQLLELDEVTKQTVLAPIAKILSNAGITEPFHKDLSDDKNFTKGYDVKDFKDVDMFEAGIIDTVKGVKNALINSSSSSNNLIRCENIITIKRNDDAK